MINKKGLKITLSDMSKSRELTGAHLSRTLQKSKNVWKFKQQIQYGKINRLGSQIISKSVWEILACLSLATVFSKTEKRTDREQVSWEKKHVRNKTTNKTICLNATACKPVNNEIQKHCKKNRKSWDYQPGCHFRRYNKHSVSNVIYRKRCCITKHLLYETFILNNWNKSRQLTRNKNLVAKM